MQYLMLTLNHEVPIFGLMVFAFVGFFGNMEEGRLNDFFPSPEWGEGFPGFGGLDDYIHIIDICVRVWVLSC